MGTPASLPSRSGSPRRFSNSMKLPYPTLAMLVCIFWILRTHFLEILLHTWLRPAFQRIGIDYLLNNVLFELDVRDSFRSCNNLSHRWPDQPIQPTIREPDPPRVHTS